MFYVCGPFLTGLGEFLSRYEGGRSLKSIIGKTHLVILVNLVILVDLVILVILVNLVILVILVNLVTRETSRRAKNMHHL